MYENASCVLQGQASDIAIHAEEILKLKGQINRLYEQHTKQSIQKLGEPVTLKTWYPKALHFKYNPPSLCLKSTSKASWWKWITLLFCAMSSTVTVSSTQRNLSLLFIPWNNQQHFCWSIVRIKVCDLCLLTGVGMCMQRKPWIEIISWVPPSVWSLESLMRSSSSGHHWKRKTVELCLCLCYCLSLFHCPALTNWAIKPCVGLPKSYIYTCMRYPICHFGSWSGTVFYCLLITQNIFRMEVSGSFVL